MPHSDGDRLPELSVVIPCRQEARHIRSVLDSVLSTDYPDDRLEVLVVDGLSDDGTRAEIEAVARRNPRVRLLDNPKRIIPAALNIGVAAAHGDVIVRLDAHTTYPPDYLRRCVEGLIATGAANVGGTVRPVPSDDTILAHAFAVALAHPFGTGMARYRRGVTRETEADTVPFGCMWRSTLEDIGPYDERFARSEDVEYSARIRKRGGRLVLLPGIVADYQTRATLGGFMRHSLSNGYWVLFPLTFGRLPVNLRHFVPFAFVMSLLLPAAGALWWPPAALVAAAAGGGYTLAALAASAQAAVRGRRPALLLALPFVFAILHLLYGLGSTAGLAHALWHRIVRGRGP